MIIDKFETIVVEYKTTVEIKYVYDNKPEIFWYNYLYGEVIFSYTGNKGFFTYHYGVVWYIVKEGEFPILQPSSPNKINPNHWSTSPIYFYRLV